MRNLFILLLIIIGSNLYGQTDSIEKVAINRLEQKFNSIQGNK